MGTELIRGIYNVKPKHKGCVVTIGSFDGVHVGHQALLDKVKERAALMNTHSMVITFEPLPKEYFGRNQMIPRLTRFGEKFDAFQKRGINKMFILHFNAKLAAFTAEDFVKHILCDKLSVKEVIVGEDFRFGKARQGNIALLKEAGKRYGFTVTTLPDVIIENQRVSSTLVRNALAAANHPLAEKLLGRPYTMQGRVVHGDKRGRILGFPTANIYLHRAATPVQGIYVVRMHGLAEKSLPGVANIGTRPTIGGTRSLLEVHLFDFNQDIYGRHVTVEFCKKLRDEERYETLEALREQIFKDAINARNYFAK